MKPPNFKVQNFLTFELHIIFEQYHDQKSIIPRGVKTWHSVKSSSSIDCGPSYVHRCRDREIVFQFPLKYEMAHMVREATPTRR